MSAVMYNIVYICCMCTCYAVIHLLPGCRRGEEELVNTEVGHLLRTKAHTDNEGGIVAGFATIDSPLIVDQPTP